MSRNREEKFMAIEYLGLSEINGPLVVLEGVKNASYEEIVEFHMDDGTRKIGRIIEIYEDKAVIQVFEGTVLKKQGGSNRATFTVRKSSNGVGVEKTWPLHSPHVVKVEVIRRGKVRRAKLNYLRDRVGKAAKVKELVK